MSAEVLVPQDEPKTQPATQPVTQPVRMRGRSYVAFVFAPVVPIVEWLSEIDQTIARSPGFFVGKPVVLDLSAVDLSRPAISHLLLSLEKRNIRVLGIEGIEATRLGANMPPLLSGGRSCVVPQLAEAKAEASNPPPPASRLLR